MKPEKRKIKSFGFFILMCLAGCLDPYLPPMILVNGNILVVEGFINATEQSATVLLSHAQSLSSPERPKPEVNAMVSIHGDDGTSFLLGEKEPGKYTRASVGAKFSQKYQLRIVTKNGGQFQSDYVELRQSPVIDRLQFELEDDGVEVLIDTHDPSGATRYYRWDYVETWEYVAAFRSDYELINKQPRPRIEGAGIYKCWRSAPSTKILVASTQRLAEDVVTREPLTFLPVGSQELSLRYSILAKQRSITKVEYDYLLQLQKSTESLGGLFDPQPSQVKGNIRNTVDAGLPVLGFFSGSSVSEKRIFIGFDELPTQLRVKPSKGSCSQDTVCVALPNPYGLKCAIDLKNLKGTEMITGSIITPDIITIGFLKTVTECADCRVQGGSTTMPAFW